MRASTTCETTMATATAADVWTTWSDLAAYPEWDPREEINEPGGPLAVGMRGRFKQRGRGAGTYVITAVKTGESWTSETGLPGGRLIIDHEMTDTSAGAHVQKRYTAVGPMAPMFALFFARGIRREMPGTFAALAAEIDRRAAAAQP